MALWLSGLSVVASSLRGFSSGASLPRAARLSVSAADTRIRHVILLKFVDTATQAQRDAVKNGIMGLKASIPEIQSVACGQDAQLPSSTGNFDFAACVDFASAGDYDVYRQHPVHLDLIQGTIKPILQTRTAVQFRLD